MSLADFGYVLILFSFITSTYSCLASFLASKLRQKKLYFSAKVSATNSFILLFCASIILWLSLFHHDYSISYVYKNSSLDLPKWFLISSFWSSLEGSHLLWTLLLAFFSTLAIWTHASENTYLMPFINGALQGIIAWMCYLAAFHCDPFLAQFPPATNGLGMNELLQNPYMFYHPPSLFTGYTALAIPFAYSFGALCYGDTNESWLKTMKRWSLFAWIFLTIGIFLGGRWAYVELGWAGYWAWDPVENSSFIPWLFTSSLLHSLIIQKKIGHLKRLNISLSFLSFFFSFFGTFITRSGVISSVHAFAQSPIGPNYLYFLCTLLVIAGVTYSFRHHHILAVNPGRTWKISKEASLLFAQFLFITFIGIVLLGTLYPILSEIILDDRFNVQAPYFNTFAPYIGFLIILSMTAGNMLHYGSSRTSGSLKTHITVLLISFFPTVIFCHYGQVFESNGMNFILQLFGVTLCFWSLVSFSWQLFYKLSKKSKSFRINLSQNLPSIASYFAHVGILIAILGFLGNYRGVNQLSTLNVGESANIYGYELNFQGIKVDSQDNMLLYKAPLKVSKDNKYLTHLYPARAKYPTKEELIHEIDFAPSFFHDIYVSLIDFDQSSGKQATVEIHINPTVKLVWISGLILVFGGFLALIATFKKRKSILVGV
ncbi:MAG: hypothetical protein CMP11_01690 [Zetaproteobacteria bacterium]|nr:hypothetical protein [Pseudobdellovibrionaceae bacterium]